MAIFCHHYHQYPVSILQLFTSSNILLLASSFSYRLYCSLLLEMAKRKLSFFSRRPIKYAPTRLKTTWQKSIRTASYWLPVILPKNFKSIVSFLLFRTNLKEVSDYVLCGFESHICDCIKDTFPKHLLLARRFIYCFFITFSCCVRFTFWSPETQKFNWIRVFSKCLIIIGKQLLFNIELCFSIMSHLKATINDFTNIILFL